MAVRWVEGRAGLGRTGDDARTWKPDFLFCESLSVLVLLRVSLIVGVTVVVLHGTVMDGNGNGTVGFWRSGSVFLGSSPVFSLADLHYNRNKQQQATTVPVSTSTSTSRILLYRPLLRMVSKKTKKTVMLKVELRSLWTCTSLDLWWLYGRIDLANGSSL